MLQAIYDAAGGLVTDDWGDVWKDSFALCSLPFMHDGEALPSSLLPFTVRALPCTVLSMESPPSHCPFPGFPPPFQLPFRCPCTGRSLSVPLTSNALSLMTHLDPY